MDLDKSGTKRITQEYEEIKKENSLKDIGGSVTFINNNIYHWLVSIKGPKKSPYENGIFYLDVNFKSDYPISKPEISFLTPIWHPNISEDTGHIVLDYIRRWNEKSNIKESILIIFILMLRPNLNSPLNLKANCSDYDKIAREYTKKYANEFQDYSLIDKYGNKPIKLNIRDSKGKSTVLSIRLIDKVGLLRDKYCKEFCYEYDGNFCFDGEILRNDKIIGDYHIGEGDVLLFVGPFLG